MSSASVNESEPLLDPKKQLAPQQPPPVVRRHSTLSLVSVAYAMLMGNVEYAIVMPSLFLYLKTLDHEVPDYYFGFCLGGFNLASMLASPFFGTWVDNRPMREICIFCMFVGVIGNAVYALAPNIYVVLLGRLISGVGGNIYNIGMTYVIRSSSDEERSGLVAKVLLIYYCGMLFGPALNYPLSLLGRYKLPLFEVNALNAPGFLMVIMLLLAVLILYMFFEEPMDMSELRSADLEGHSKKGCGKYRPLFTSFTLMSLIVMQFLVQYTQIVMETLVTPVTSMYYNFGQLENSLVYAAITAVFFVLFGLIIILARHVQDRILVAIGVLFFGASFVFAVIIYYQAPNPDTYDLPFWSFCTIVVLAISGIPFFLSAMSSLFSKLVGDKRIQGMGQSMMNVATSLAAILGPTISGFLLPFVGRIWIMLLGTWGFIVILLAFRWRVFYTARDQPAAEDVTTTVTTGIEPAIRHGSIQKY